MDFDDVDKKWFDIMMTKESVDSEMIDFSKCQIFKLEAVKANCAYPFDDRISDIFIKTTGDIITEFNMTLGYTYAYEIYIFWCPHIQRTKYKKSKCISEICSFASVRLNWHLSQLAVEPPLKLGTIYFSGIAFPVKNINDSFNYVYWKISRCAINYSIDKTAELHFSKKQLNDKNNLEKIKMLAEKKIQWNDIPDSFKFGIFVKKKIFPEKIIIRGKNNVERTESILNVKLLSCSMNIPGYTADLSNLLFNRILNDASNWKFVY